MPEQTTGRRLKINHSTPIPRYILVVDTTPKIRDTDGEQKQFRHTFGNAHIVSGRIARGSVVSRTEQAIPSCHDFWQAVYKSSGPRHTLWVVGHSILYHLTILGIATEFEHSVISLDRPRAKRETDSSANPIAAKSGICVLDAPPTILGCRVTRTQGRVIFVDIQNYFKGSIYELGVTVGRRLSDSGQSNNLVDRGLCRSREAAEIIFDTFANLALWVEEKDFGVFKYTAAGQSMNCFRHKYMNHPILIHDNLDVKTFERHAYFGGRTEVFRKGIIDQTVFQYDVNALYPFVMQHGKFPKSLLRFSLGGGERCAALDISPECCVAEVTITTKKALYPLRTDAGIIFPVGQFRTTLCGEELKAASDQGCINTVHAWAEYDCDRIFETFVTELWALRSHYRESGQKQYEAFVKMLMNALYGKFGQKGPKWEDRPEILPPDPWREWKRIVPNCHESERFRAVGWNVQQHVGDTELLSSFVAIPSFVTASARVHMNKAREIAGVKNVYYQGCDSLIVNTVGSSRLSGFGCVNPDEIGKLKCETTGNFAEIYGCLDYRIGSKSVIAGRCPVEQYESQSTMMQRKLQGQSALFTGFAADHVDELILPWERRGNYVKGTVGEDGWIDPICYGTDSTSISVSPLALDATS